MVYFSGTTKKVIKLLSSVNSPILKVCQGFLNVFKRICMVIFIQKTRLRVFFSFHINGFKDKKKIRFVCKKKNIFTDVLIAY